MSVFENLLGTVRNTFRIAKANLDASGVTAARTLTLQDKTGTVALTAYSALIGDNSATLFTITQATHGRAANRTNLVQVLEESSGDRVIPDVTVNSNGDVVIAFAVAPSASQYRVTILG